MSTAFLNKKEFSKTHKQPKTQLNDSVMATVASQEMAAHRSSKMAKFKNGTYLTHLSQMLRKPTNAMV